MRKNDFLKGMAHGIPIALGYLSVSFGFGITAVKAGLSVLEASLISLTNLTSAGQAAGVDVIASNGTLLEMILVQLTINIRYALMALSLSQKLDTKFHTSEAVYLHPMELRTKFSEFVQRKKTPSNQCICME